MANEGASRGAVETGHRREIGFVNLAGLIQGIALVTFPAASYIFTSSHGYGFKPSRYGMMFIPQVILAILASSLSPTLARRWTLKRVFQAGLGANLLAMTLLLFSWFLRDSRAAAYGTLLAATGSLGFGFGSALMAMNTYAEAFAPSHEARAVLVLNGLLGTGTALAPLFVAIFLGLGAWWLLPAIVAVALVVLLIVSTREPLKAPDSKAAASSWGSLPSQFWLFAAAVLLYGIAETLNGNWSGQFLTQDRGVSAQIASFALMAFWGMVTIGRIMFATLSSRNVRWIFIGLPAVLILAFQSISHVGGKTSGVFAFGLAGLACSAFFPLCISLSGSAFPRFTAAMSGTLIAFYQAGYGVAAFGVGPLHELAGLSFHTIYSLGSVVAALMLCVAVAAVIAISKRD